MSTLYAGNPTHLRKNLFISFAGVLGSALMWLLSFKIVAIWLGPEGVGLFSQMRQIVQAVTIGATFGGTNAVVQGLAEKSDDVQRHHFRVVASRLIGLAGLILVSLVLIFAESLSRFSFSSTTPDVVSAIRWLGLAVLLSVASTYSIAVLNGYRFFRFLAAAQLAGPVALLIMLSGFYYFEVTYRPEMLAWSFALCFSVTFLCGALGMSRLPKALPELVEGVFYLPQARSFLRFALSIMAAAMSATIAMLLIRSWIIAERGLAFSGIFDAGWMLTFNYVTLFLTACNTIYLPLLTAAGDDRERRSCVLKMAYLVLLGCVLACYFLAVFKISIIHLLYSSQFEATGNVLVILSIAVILRGVSWVYGVMILATRDIRTLLVSDLGLNGVLLLSVWVALHQYATLESLGWAFVLSNLVYLVFIVEYARQKNGLMFRRDIWPLIVLAVLPLFLMTGMGSVDQGVLMPFLIAALAMSWASWNAYKKVEL